MIVNSTYTESSLQQDGRRYVKEIHTDNQGLTYVYEWLGDQDIQTVIQSRVQVLNEEIGKRNKARELVFGTKVPLTKLEFRKLFTLQERTMIDSFEVTFESLPNLTTEQKAVIRTAYNDFSVAQDIVVPFVQDILDMLDMFVLLGLLTAERKAEIVSAGNG